MDTPDDGDALDGAEANPDADTEVTVESLQKQLETTEKRRRDQDSIVQKSMAEAKAAREALEQLRTQSKLVETVERLASASAKPDADDGAASKAQYERLRDDVATALRTGETEAAEKLLELMPAYARDAEDRGEAKAAAKFKALEEKLEERFAAQEERWNAVDPDVAPYRAKMVEIAEQTGLDLKNDRDRKVLSVLAKAATKTEHPPREQFPGSAGGGGGRVGAGGEGRSLAAGEESYLTDGLPGGKLTKAEREQLALR